MMISVLKKLNWVHIGLLLVLPIILALINPNWTFNLHILDDYIYLGHQIALPKYLGWSVDTGYFIERLTLILPGYWVRQIFSPLIANFILHLMVYYLACFSVYGILHKLFNQRVAIFTTLLFGHYPLVMRATGWDYTDGIGMACLALGIYWLTQSTYSRRQSLYAVLAGTTVTLILGANIFNVLYVPFVAVYWLALTNFRFDLRRWFVTIVCVISGLVIVYGLMALIYYQLTNRIWFSASIQFLQQSASAWTVNSLGAQFNFIHPYWHIFFILIVILNITYLLRHMPSVSPHRQHILAMMALFTGCFAVIAISAVLGFAKIRISFYNTNLALVAFLSLGAIFSVQEQLLSARQFRFVVMSAFIFPIIPFGVQTIWYTPFNADTYFYLFGLIGVIFFLVLIVKSNSVRTYLLLLFFMANSVMVGHVPFISIYYPNRFHLQNIYEKSVFIANIINARYKTLDFATFRILYEQSDPYQEIFIPIGSMYIPSQESLRIGFLDQAMPDIIFTSQEIVFLSSQMNSQQLVYHLEETLFDKQLRFFVLDETQVDNIGVFFLGFQRSLLNIDGNRLLYDFSERTSAFVIVETGWNGYEQVPQNGRPFRWTSEPSARLVLDMSEASFDATATYQLSFVIAGYLEDEVVNSLTLMVNGVSIPLQRADNKYVGQMSGQYLLNPTLELVFQTDRVSNPFDLGIQDGRKLGVAIGELIIDRVIESN